MNLGNLKLRNGNKFITNKGEIVYFIGILPFGKELTCIYVFEHYNRISSISPVIFRVHDDGIFDTDYEFGFRLELKVTRTWVNLYLENGKIVLKTFSDKKKALADKDSVRTVELDVKEKF